MKWSSKCTPAKRLYVVRAPLAGSVLEARGHFFERIGLQPAIIWQMTDGANPIWGRGLVQQETFRNTKKDRQLVSLDDLTIPPGSCSYPDSSGSRNGSPGSRSNRARSGCANEPTASPTLRADG